MSADPSMPNNPQTPYHSDEYQDSNFVHHCHNNRLPKNPNTDAISYKTNPRRPWAEPPMRVSGRCNKKKAPELLLWSLLLLGFAYCGTGLASS